MGGASEAAWDGAAAHSVLAGLRRQGCIILRNASHDGVAAQRHRIVLGQRTADAGLAASTASRPDCIGYTSLM